ncbi:unnamed protein product, partial [Rotaria socialis]
MYSLYSSAAGVHPHWQLARSPPQQQQQSTIDQPRAYGNGQNATPQHASSTSATNTTGRPASASGQTSSGSSTSGHPITPQYTFNGAMPTAFAYGTPAGWIPAPQ